MKSKNFDACEEMLRQSLVSMKEMVRDVTKMNADLRIVRARAKARKAAQS